MLRLIAILSLLLALPATAAPRVVATIAPLHSLVAGVMEGVGEPRLLVEGTRPLHGYRLRPSQVRLLERADLVVWIGPSLESFLERPLARLGRERVVTVEALQGLHLLSLRHGGVWHHDHDHAHEASTGKRGATDGHLWLDPRNGVRIVEALTERLAALDPANGPRYRHNGERLRQRLELLDRHLARRLATVADRPYLVFHDAFHYFEARYHLAGAGALTLDPERRPGARRLREIRQLVERRGVRCIFREPQYRGAALAALAGDTGLRVATLDPLGAGLPAGPDLYFRMMETMADSFVGCLGGEG